MGEWGHLQLPDAVDHVKQGGYGEADEEHEDGDGRFKIIDGAVEHDLVGS